MFTKRSTLAWLLVLCLNACSMMVNGISGSQMDALPVMTPSLRVSSNFVSPTAYFESDETSAKQFECRVDDESWFLCSSPLNLGLLPNITRGFEGVLFVRA